MHTLKLTTEQFEALERVLKQHKANIYESKSFHKLNVLYDCEHMTDILLKIENESTQ
jgi:hypothetical protein